MPRGKKAGGRKASIKSKAGEVVEDMDAEVVAEDDSTVGGASFTSDTDEGMDTSAKDTSLAGEDEPAENIEEESSEKTDANHESSPAKTAPSTVDEKVTNPDEVSDEVIAIDSESDTKLSTETGVENGASNAVEPESNDDKKDEEEKGSSDSSKKEKEGKNGEKESDGKSGKDGKDKEEEEEEEEEEVIEVESDPGSDLDEGDTQNVSDAEFMIFSLPDEQTVVGELTEMISKRKVLVYPVHITDMSHPVILGAIQQCSEFKTNFAESNRTVVSPVSGGTATVDPPAADTGAAAAAVPAVVVPVAAPAGDAAPTETAPAGSASDTPAVGALHWVGLIELCFKSTFAALDSMEGLRQIREDLTVRVSESNESDKKIIQQWKVAAKIINAKTTENVLYVNLISDPAAPAPAPGAEPGAAAAAAAPVEIKVDQLRELFPDAIDISITKNKYRHCGYILFEDQKSLDAALERITASKPVINNVKLVAVKYRKPPLQPLGLLKLSRRYRNLLHVDRLTRKMSNTKAKYSESVKKRMRRTISKCASAIDKDNAARRNLGFTAPLLRELRRYPSIRASLDPEKLWKPEDGADGHWSDEDDDDYKRSSDRRQNRDGSSTSRDDRYGSNRGTRAGVDVKRRREDDYHNNRRSGDFGDRRSGGHGGGGGGRGPPSWGGNRDNYERSPAPYGRDRGFGGRDGGRGGVPSLMSMPVDGRPINPLQRVQEIAAQIAEITGVMNLARGGGGGGPFGRGGPMRGGGGRGGGFRGRRDADEMEPEEEEFYDERDRDRDDWGGRGRGGRGGGRGGFAKRPRTDDAEGEHSRGGRDEKPEGGRGPYPPQRDSSKDGGWQSQNKPPGGGEGRPKDRPSGGPPGVKPGAPPTGVSPVRQPPPQGKAPYNPAQGSNAPRPPVPKPGPPGVPGGASSTNPSRGGYNAGPRPGGPDASNRGGLNNPRGGQTPGAAARGGYNAAGGAGAYGNPVGYNQGYNQGAQGGDYGQAHRGGAHQGDGGYNQGGYNQGGYNQVANYNQGGGYNQGYNQGAGGYGQTGAPGGYQDPYNQGWTGYDATQSGYGYNYGQNAGGVNPPPPPAAPAATQGWGQGAAAPPAPAAQQSWGGAAPVPVPPPAQAASAQPTYWTAQQQSGWPAANTNTAAAGGTAAPAAGAGPAGKQDGYGTYWPTS